GRTIVEAMLVSRPVISTRTGAAPETVLNGETGLLVEPDKPLELARALDRLRMNPALAQRLTETARRRAQDLYSAARMRDGIDKVLQEIFPGTSP
ncbi:glycosyltransferase family 4 protein, partial [Arthrobacter sp.]|uniref:glycosyltransferase n=1 Tax=Arthrobacter sp. TaxID=1667 RepID=UPI00258A2177